MGGGVVGVVEVEDAGGFPVVGWSAVCFMVDSFL